MDTSLTGGSSGGGAGSGTSGTGSSTSAATAAHQVSSFDPNPYGTTMGSSAAAAAAAYYSPSSHRKDGHHSSHGLPFWPNDAYKYPGTPSSITECQAAFGAQSWCNYSPYATRVPSHMDTHGQPVSYLTAAAVSASEDRKPFVDPASFHESYGIRNAYGAPDPSSASPYPPSGKVTLHFRLHLFSSMKNAY